MYNILLFFTLFTLFTAASSDCPNVYGTNFDRRTNKNVLRLMQYNVEWLFLDYYASADCPGDKCSWHTQDDALVHLKYVSDVITTLNPDIVNLCEVEGCYELQTLLENIGSDSGNYTAYLKQGTDTGTGQNVALLTKISPITDLNRTEERVAYPISGSLCNANSLAVGSFVLEDSTGVSKHYITTFSIPGIERPIAFIGAHLIAKPTDPIRCAQREAQAQIIQNLVVEYVSNGYEIIVWGDLNDFDANVPDINSHKPISQVLNILKGLVGQWSGFYELVNVAEYISPQSERYTDWYNSDDNCNTMSQEDFSVLDYILVSSDIEKRIKTAFIYHGYDEYCGKWNSDHYPIIVDIQT